MIPGTRETLVFWAFQPGYGRYSAIIVRIFYYFRHPFFKREHHQLCQLSRKSETNMPGSQLLRLPFRYWALF